MAVERTRPAATEGIGRSQSVRLHRTSAVPALVAAAPIFVSLCRLLVTLPSISLFGDPALIDIATARVLTGHTLLGPYSRYGWHHPGPIWFFWLALFRAVGNGSPIALQAGYLVEQAAAIVLIVVLTDRWLGRRAAWIMAALLAAFQFSFTYTRVVLIWNPYAVALPALLFVLAAAVLVCATRIWLSALACALSASFLIQTDVSTVLVALLVFMCALVARFFRVRKLKSASPQAVKPYRYKAVVEVALGGALVAALWVPPVYEQLTTAPGNIRLLRRFNAANGGVQHGREAFEAIVHVLGAFPFRFGDPGQVQDANPAVLSHHLIWTLPLLPIYVIGGAVLAGCFLRRGDHKRAALSGLTVVALVAGLVSAELAAGPLYPYHVLWLEPLLLPLWLLAIEAGTQVLARRSKLRRSYLLPAAACFVSAVVAISTFFSPVASGTSINYAQQAWQVVRPAVSAPGVHRVLVRPATAGDVGIASAITDRVMRSGKTPGLPPEWRYLVDPGFYLHGKPDLEIIVCCSRAFPINTPGTRVVGYVGGTVPILVRKPT